MERRLRNPHWRLEQELARSFVRLTRTEVPFERLDELVASVTELCTLLDTIGRANMALLVDLRDGPMRTDTAFELAMSEQRTRLLLGIPRVAVLVRTSLGAMQLNRHQRQGRVEFGTFNDEKSALAHLGIIVN